MKKALILIALFITINAIAQDDKTVTLTVTGQGKTIDAAKTNALRSAIEQAFGAFISSNTTILNDRIIKDEIVSVTNGSIQKFDVLNETTMPDGSFFETLSATVSVNKLTNYCKTKGFNIEFNGSLFAQNIAIQELNKSNELKAWGNIKTTIQTLINNSFNYKIDASDPKFIENDSYSISLKVTGIGLIDNFKTVDKIIYDFARNISLKKEDIDYYQATNIPFYTIKLLNKHNGYFTFRNRKVQEEILNLPYNFLNAFQNGCIINNGIDDNFNPTDNERELQFGISQSMNRDIFTTKFPYKYFLEDMSGIIVLVNNRWVDHDRSILQSLEFAKDGGQSKFTDISTFSYWGLGGSKEEDFRDGFNLFNEFNKDKELFTISFDYKCSLDKLKKIKEFKIIKKM